MCRVNGIELGFRNFWLVNCVTESSLLRNCSLSEPFLVGCFDDRMHAIVNNHLTLNAGCYKIVMGKKD